MDGKEEKQLKVAFYLRVSTDEQVEKFGLDAQRVTIEGAIKSKGKLDDGRESMVLAGEYYVYKDEGIKGDSQVNERPGFARLKEDYLNSPPDQKPFDIVAVYKIDRFARKLSILLDVIDFFEKQQIEFISAHESIDTSTPFGRAMLGILGVIAELELATIKERTQAGKERAKEKGKYMGGPPPFGYQRDADGRLAIIEEEAKIVRKIFNWFVVEKFSVQKIADFLTADEVLTPSSSAIALGKFKGKNQKSNKPHFWRAETVKEMIASEVYIGNNFYDKSKDGKPLLKSEWKKSTYTHPSITLDHIFLLAQQRLETLSERKDITKKKEQGHLYLLSGLLKCDNCKDIGSTEKGLMSWTGGGKSLSKDKSSNSYYYYCNRKNSMKFSTICTVVPIPAESLENYVVGFIKKLLSNPSAVYNYQLNLDSTKLLYQNMTRDKDEYQRILDALPNRRIKVLEQHKLGHIVTEKLNDEIRALDEKQKDFNSKINQIDYQLSQRALSEGYQESFRLYSAKYGQALEKALKDRKELYELIHMIVSQIVVYSRPKKDTDTIAGRKKQDQFIPNKVDIYLNLPQNMLRELYTQKFGVKSGPW